MTTWSVPLLCLALLGLASPVRSAPLERFSSLCLRRPVAIALHVPTDAVVARWKLEHPGSPMQLVLFLPGAFDGPKDFLREGLETDLAGREAQGELPPSLWVAVTHFQSWYADRRDGTFPYERFLMEELLPALEARHPGFGGSAAARSVAGLSMGGFGALNLASRTRAFGRCLALSPALVRAPFSDLPWYVRRSLTRIFPSEPDAFAPWNPWRHLGGTTELVIGCGMEDRHGLAATCRTFAQVCADRQRPLQLELSPGGHDWTYWTPAFRRWAFWLAGGPSGDSPGASRANRP